MGPAVPGGSEFDQSTVLTGDEVPAWLGGAAPPGTPLYQGWVRFAEGEDAELWDSAGRLVAQSRQLALVTG